MRDAKLEILQVKATQAAVNSGNGCADLNVPDTPETGELLPLSNAEKWEAIFKRLDEAGIPEDFLNGRAQDMPQVRDDP